MKLYCFFFNCTVSTKKEKQEKCYHVRFKLWAIEVANKKFTVQAAQEFGVDRRTICQWMKQENQLLNEDKSKHTCLKGAGWKPLDEDIKCFT